ncbi:retrovirus-related pol polyprotein from transposon TNT 1-94 [Tanacetum coccineum]
MNGNRRLFTTYKEYDGGHVVFGSNLKGKVIGGVFLESKDDTLENFKILSKTLENLHDYSIVSIDINHSSEFDKLQFGSFCEQHGMSYNLSGPSTSQSGEIVERTNCKLRKMSHAISIAYIVLNKKTIRIEEFLNVTIDKSLPEPKSSPLVKDGRINEPTVQDLNGLPSLQVNVSDDGNPKSVKEARVHPIEQVLGESGSSLDFHLDDSWMKILPDYFVSSPILSKSGCRSQ